MSSPAPVSSSGQSERLRIRRWIVTAFWATLALGIPFWWKTTTIERRSLPEADIAAWSKLGPCHLRPRVNVEVAAPFKGCQTERRIAEGVETALKAADGARCALVYVFAEDNKRRMLPRIYRISSEADEAECESSPGRTAFYALAEGDHADAAIGDAVDAAKSLLGLDLPASDARVAKFSPRYKLVFSLLNQDSSIGGALLDWDVQAQLDQHLSPLLSSLAHLHKFSIETQIQYFAPLAVNVNPDEVDGTVVAEDDLKAFVNAAGWNLGSAVTLDPVLNFMLYVPSLENRPMRIQSESASAANAFILPQRGGVVIFNPDDDKPDLSPAFRLFEQQLRRLLGVPPALPGHSSSGALESWQVDAMVRKRLAEAVKESVETLAAIVKLVEDIPNMPVGADVQRGVRDSLAQLEAAREALWVSPIKALKHASLALEQASKAYFNPTMLALLYFPDEHKYTVYAPFFGPVAVPLLAALAKEIKEWKDKRRKSRAAEAEVEAEGAKAGAE